MTRRKILVADELSGEGMELLKQAGEVTIQTGMDEDTLRETLPPYHVLVVRSATKVTARSLELAENLAVIGRAGIGVDNIDVEAATDRGIVVMNTPEAGAVTTGEHALSLLVSMARNIPAADASMKDGRWDKSKLTGTELTNKTLGVLGLGRIGGVVADRAHGLHMKVIAYDPYLDEAHAPAWLRLVTLEELLAESDFVTVHVPLADSTRHLLNRERIGMMKQGARLVHAARGGIVDEEALCEALRDGRLAGAALDVFEREPLPDDSPLRSTPNLILTPHLGASTVEAKRNVSLDMANQVVTCLDLGIVVNGINVPRVGPNEAARITPYMKLAHHLPAFLLQIFDGPLESLRLTLQGELPASAQRPLTVAMLAGALQRRVEGPVTPVNAERIAKETDLRVHTETSTLKRDFVNLIRVEAIIGGNRHFMTGTVLGERHIRMIEMDDFMLDAIPEGPMLVTFNRDVPGVLGKIGTILGEEDINISRLQLGGSPSRQLAFAIWNLSTTLTPRALDRVRAEDAIVHAFTVEV